MSHYPAVRLYLLSILVLSLFCVSAGCESAPKAGGRLDGAIQHYQAQQFNLAHQQAVEVMRTPGMPSEQREQATYLAGLSAYRMGDMSEAELRFGAVMSTSNRTLLGSAQAMMGQIRLEQKRASEAVVYFEHAARSLAGEDKKQADRYAAIAKFEAGDIAAMQRWHEASSTGASSGRTSSGGFTLQIGAFQDRLRAEQAASDVSATARRFGYSPVNIRHSTDSRGRTLFLVHMGVFPTRQAAANARANLGRLDYIVASLPRS